MTSKTCVCVCVCLCVHLCATTNFCRTKQSSHLLKNGINYLKIHKCCPMWCCTVVIIITQHCRNSFSFSIMSSCNREALYFNKSATKITRNIKTFPRSFHGKTQFALYSIKKHFVFLTFIFPFFSPSWLYSSIAMIINYLALHKLL